MKKIIYLSVFIIVIGNAGAQDKKTEGLVQQPVVKLFDGVSKLDDAFMRSQVTDDFILIEDMKVWTIDSLINVLKPQKQADYKRVNSFVFKKTEYKGDMAWVYYENTADITSNGKPSRTVHWLESAVLVKQQGEWKIKLMHSTRLK
jgi:hypothetical protein